MKNDELMAKYDLIEKGAMSATSKDAIEIAISLMRLEGISMHGPEHHFLDGAAFLSAYHNAGGEIDLPSCLRKLRERSVMMPGAICGYWGVCGSVSSVGAALSIIHEVSPLSRTDFYKDDLEFSSLALKKMSEIGGPRCCKRNAFISLATATELANRKYGVKMTLPKTVGCEFVMRNPDCLYVKCPFFGKKTVF